MKHGNSIFIFSIAYEPFIGGAEVAIAEICKRQNRPCVVFTPRYSADAPKHEQKGNIEIVRIGALWVPLFLRKVLYIFQAAFLAWRRKGECVFGWSMMANHCGFATLFFSKLSGRSYLLTLQEGDEFGTLTSRWYMRLLSPLFRAIFTHAVHIQCISKYLAEVAVSFAPKAETSVIPNGVDTQRFSPVVSEHKQAIRQKYGIPDTAQVLVTSSRLVSKNGVDRVIRALSHLPQMHFLILGEGGEEGELHALASHEGVADRVHFAGFIPHADLPQHLAAGDVFIRLSRSEGLGISFLEAMAMGLPVVCTNVGGIPEFAKDNETAFISFEPENEDDVAKTILRACTNVAVAEAGRNLILEKYQWDPIAHAMDELFNVIAAQVMKPKVVIVSGIYPPDIGGPATHASAIAHDLNEKGMGVTVVCFGEYFDDKHNGVRVVRVSRQDSKLGRWINYFLAIWKASRGASVLYAFDLTTAGISTWLICRLRGIPYLLRIGGDPIWERVVESGKRFIDIGSYYKNGFQHVDKPFLFRMVQTVVKGAAHISVDNAFMRDFYVGTFGANTSRIDVVPNPVYDTPLPQAKEDNGFIFVYAGRFVSYKNIPKLVEAFSMVHKKNPSARLHLIGEGPDESLIRNTMMKCGVADSVSIFAKMSRKQLHDVLEKAHVAVAPALSEFNPNTILEALSLGRPILISQGSGLSVSVPEIWQFNPFDIHSMANAMLYMMQHYADAILERKKLEFTSTWESVLALHEKFVREQL